MNDTKNAYIAVEKIKKTAPCIVLTQYYARCSV